jgi:hypothetical protein
VGLGVIGLVSSVGCGSATRTVTVRVPARTVTASDPAKQTHTQPLPRVVRSAPRAGLPHLGQFVPSDAQVLNAWTLPAAGGVPEQVAVTWRRQTHRDDYAEYALVIWERSGSPGAPSWRRIHRLDKYRYAQKVDVEDIAVHVGDVSGDGHLDVLAYQDGDGSGGCGDYDLLVTAPAAVHNVFHAEECSDNTVIALRPNALVIDRGLAYAPHGNHIHPVFRTFRRTIKRWNGRRLVTVHRAVIAPSQTIGGRYDRPR